MNIVEKIRQFLTKFKKKEEIKLIADGTQNYNRYNEFISDLSVPNNVPNEPSIEECVCEFIKQYEIREKYDNKDVDPYKAFVGMFCKEEDEGKNEKNQRKLSEYVRKLGLRVDYQHSSNKISFMHIRGEKGIDDRNPDVEKLYINCDRKNIALLTAEILKNIQGIVGDKLHMKCVAEQIVDDQKEYESQQKVKNYQRNDKIVLYAENSDVADRLAEEINLIRSKKPELFSNNKPLPFLPKKCGFIGFAKEKRRAAVETPIGHASGITYNDFISDIFYQSIISGFDKEFGVNSKESIERPNYRMKQYAEVFPQLSKEQRESVLKNCKDIFIDVCTRGKVETVYTKNIENNRDFNDRMK